MTELDSIEEKRFLELKKFQKMFSIRFNNIKLLDQAFIHSSYSSTINGERLEFLGDAVLGLVVCEELYKRLDKEHEGVLAKMKSFVVCEETLAKIGFHFGFDRYLSLSKGEEKTGGRKKRAIVADSVESVIGAYYLDSGFKKARSFVLCLVSDFISSVIEKKSWYDYKSLLQVFLQQTFSEIPSYTVVGVEGPDHDLSFKVQVTAAGNVYGPREGKSKKEAEQSVAKLAYEDLCNEVHN
ncbi:MAG: ribonuclease III [Treponema sp.]